MACRSGWCGSSAGAAVGMSGQERESEREELNDKNENRAWQDRGLVFRLGLSDPPCPSGSHRRLRPAHLAILLDLLVA
jgi:hypothetical protein